MQYISMFLDSYYRHSFPDHVHSESRGRTTPLEYSFSSAQARQRETFIANVSMVPSTIQWQKWKITVGDAWLEKSNDGGCYLCFRIATGREAFLHGADFVLEDLPASTKLHFGIGLKWLQAVQYLESPDTSKIRLSLIADWNEKRRKNILWVPKTALPDQKKH